MYMTPSSDASKNLMKWDHKHILQIDKSILDNKKTLSSYWSVYCLTLAENILKKTLANNKQDILDINEIFNELQDLSIFIYQNSFKQDTEKYHYIIFNEKKVRIFFDTF